LVSQKIELVPYVFVGGPKFKHLQQNFPKSLEQAPFFNYTLDSSLRWKVDEYFRTHKLNLQHFGEADDVSIQRAAARHNMCVALLPRDVASELLEDGSLYILGTGHEISSSIHVVYHGMVNDQLLRKVLASIFGSDKVDL
jgi:LysR family transcriptional activator of nhaA